MAAMPNSVLRTCFVAALVTCAVVALPGTHAEEREWQKGTWRVIKIDRPKVSFGFPVRDPSTGLPNTQTVRENRTYVIETDSLRLELKQDATSDTPRIDALVGDPVEFALDKKTVYVKDETGKEHRLSVTRQAKLAAPEAK